MTLSMMHEVLHPKVVIDSMCQGKEEEYMPRDTQKLQRKTAASNSNDNIKTIKKKTGKQKWEERQLQRYLKRQPGEICTREDLGMAKKPKEKNGHLITAQKRNNYIKAKTDNTRQQV